MIDPMDIGKEIDKLPEGWIILLETGIENSLDISMATIRVLTDKGYSGIILSANRPYSNLISLYEKNGIDTKRIFVLDSVSKDQNAGLNKADNVMYLDNISDLTDISLSVNDAIKKIAGRRFIFIDSITTMLIHNDAGIFAKFIHHLLTKMRMNGISGLLFSLANETNNEVRAEIAQLCDKVIKL